MKTFITKKFNNILFHTMLHLIILDLSILIKNDIKRRSVGS